MSSKVSGFMLELLLKALEFYSNPDNYVRDKTGFSPVDRDCGAKADMTIKNIKELLKWRQIGWMKFLNLTSAGLL